MNDFEAYLEALFENRKDSKIKDAMMYSLLNKGKRIRPRLLFAVLAAYGQDRKKGPTGFSGGLFCVMLKIV